MSGQMRDIEAHNREQVAYFEQAGKESMKPVSSPYVLRQVDELVRFAGLVDGERVLDVGCGMGRYTFPLAERGLQVEGLDLSSTLLAQLERYNGRRYDIPLHCMDVLEAPEQLGERFDAVVGFFTLHHLHDLRASFAAMAKLVKPRGRVVFLEPNPLNVLYYVQLAFAPGMTWSGDKGILQMRRGLIATAMASASLTDFAMERFGFLPPFLVNGRFGMKAERLLESFPLWRPFLPFQLFRGVRAH
jgi:2-polyprenyl-3-methyl-5-hydroxy-6-metoxy-1,4-benzoquinol methylase